MNTIEINGISVGIPGKQKTYGREAVWPSIARQVKDAQAENREKYSKQAHSPVQLYTLLEYCEHEEPEGLEKYEDVDDLVDEFLDRIGLGRENPYPVSDERYRVWYKLRYKNEKRAASVIPIVAEFNKASDEYEDSHGTGVCLDDPDDIACSYCNADSLDYGEGVEDPGCQLETWLTDEWDMFWFWSSPDGKEYRKRRYGEQS